LAEIGRDNELLVELLEIVRDVTDQYGDILIQMAIAGDRKEIDNEIQTFEDIRRVMERRQKFVAAANRPLLQSLIKRLQ